MNALIYAALLAGTTGTSISVVTVVWLFLVFVEWLADHFAGWLWHRWKTWMPTEPIVQ
jgi:hypothetical protein